MQFSTITIICASVATVLAAPQGSAPVFSVGNLQVLPASTPPTDSSNQVGNLQVLPASASSTDSSEYQVGNLQVLPSTTSERTVDAAPPAPGAEGFLACNVESDCVLKQVTAACGGMTTRCMNRSSPAALGAQTGFGICLMDPPGPDSCSCQQNKCFGIMRRPSYLGSNQVPQ